VIKWLGFRLDEIDKSIQELADDMGVGYSTAVKWISLENKIGPLLTKEGTARLAKALEWTVTELLSAIHDVDFETNVGKLDEPTMKVMELMKSLTLFQNKLLLETITPVMQVIRGQYVFNPQSKETSPNNEDQSDD
jgi:hypothetical protein